MVDTEQGRLLIVDDDAQIRSIIVRALETLDCRVVLAADGHQALELVRQQPFDLVLLDLTLPGLSGLQLLERMRAEEDVQAVPVVLMSGLDQAQVISQGLRLGAEDYLFKPFNLDLLRVRVGAALERQRLRAQQGASAASELRLQLERDARELEIARKIQADFLPEDLPAPEGWEISACFHPAREVAGDFYDAFWLSNRRRVGLVIADVCDKGVGAALFMTLVRSLIRAFADQHYSLRWMDVLGSEPEAGPEAGRRRGLPSTGSSALHNAIVLTNNYVGNNHSRLNMFATMFFGILDPASGSLIYVNGGHNPPFVVGADGVKERLKPSGPAVGMLPDMKFEIRQTVLEPGDVLFGFTDGVTDARSMDREFFSEARLEALLQPLPGTGAALLERVEGEVRRHIGDANQFDDITMLTVRRA